MILGREDVLRNLLHNGSSHVLVQHPTVLDAFLFLLALVGQLGGQDGAGSLREGISSQADGGGGGGGGRDRGGQSGEEPGAAPATDRPDPGGSSLVSAGDGFRHNELFSLIIIILLSTSQGCRNVNVNECRLPLGLGPSLGSSVGFPS